MDASDILQFESTADVLVVLREWIRAERQRLRWTQAELARRSGVPAATISRPRRGFFTQTTVRLAKEIGLEYR